MNVLVFAASSEDARRLAEPLHVLGHTTTCCASPERAVTALAAGPIATAVVSGFATAVAAAHMATLRRAGPASLAVIAGAPPGQPQLDLLAAGADDVFDPGDPGTLAVRVAVLEGRARAGGPASADVLLANATDTIYTLTLDGHFTSANPAAEQLTGYPRSELIGMHMSRIIAPEHLDSVVAEMRAKAAGEKESSFLAIDIIRPGGERVPVEITSRLLVQDGRITGIQGLARDLRPRRELERDIAFRAELLDNVEAATYAGDMAGRVIYWNSAATELFGYSPAEALGANVGTLIIPREEGSRADQSVAELRAGRKVVGEYRLKKKDGSTFPAHVTNAPVFHADGSVAAIVAICIDLTVRRAQEDRLARQAAIIASSNDAVIEHDREGRIVSWNEAAERIYGYTAAEVIGQHMGILAPQEERHQVEAVRLRVLAGSRVAGRPTRRVRRDGATVHLNISFFPVHGPDGTVIGTASVVRDLSEQMRLQESHARLAAIVDSSTEAVIGRDIERRLVSMNRAAERLFGWRAEELAGGFAWELVPGDLRDETSAMAARLREGQPVTAETERIDRAGRRFPVELNAFAVFDSAGEVVGSATFFRDISAKRAAESDLRAAQLAVAEREAILRAVFEGTSETLWMWDRELRLITANRAAVEHAVTLIGHEPRPGDSMELCVFPTLWEGFQGHHQRALRGETFGVEARIPGPDGNPTWFDYAYSPVRDQSGAVTAVVLAGREITARHTAERALRDAEVQLHSLVSNAPVIQFSISAEGIVTLAVGGGLDAIGPLRDGLVGSHISELDSRIPHLVSAFEATMAGNEASFEAVDGGLSWEVAFSPVRDRSGRVKHVIGVATNVTARKAAEAERQRLDANYRAVVEGTSDGLFVLDVEGDGAERTFRVALINQAFSLMTGLDAARVAGGRVEELFHGAVLENAFSRYAAVIASGGTITYEEPLPGAGPRWVAVTMTALFEPEGRCYRIVGSARDITERRQAQETVERLASIIESASEAIVSVDTGGHIVNWNHGAERIYGYAPEEVIGRHFNMLIPEDDAAQSQANWERVLHHQAPSQRDVRRLHKDGHIIDLQVSLFPLRDIDGEVIGTASVGTDITDKLRYERELLERAADLDAVFASSSEGIVLASPDFRILSFNDAARQLIRRLHGGDMQVGDHALTWVSESEQPAFVRNFQMALAGRSFTFAREVEPPDGPLWWEFSFAPVRLADGTARGVALGFRDITERKRTDEALLQAQKAESLAVLAGGIAHDFNNLLVGILGNAGLALAEISPESPARTTIEAIETAGQRAAELARQMLAYSGRGRFIVQNVDLNSLVEEMAHLLRVSIGKGVRLNYQFERELPPVAGDATQLRQVVMNLVVNASDAIGDSEGAIAITTRTIHATRELLAETYLAPSLKPGDYVAIEVADTGAGMDAETLSRIFDPFFTTKFTGRGLGLAAVLGIMRGHRGAIKVESEPGRGTTFRLLLPAARPDPSGSPASPPATAWHGSGTILVVDDEPSVRAVTARALQSFGFEVLEAADGTEGVETYAANRHRIVCTLLDMTMPRMGGEEAFRAIREIDPGARVLLMSGFTEQDSLVRFAGLDLAGFVQKPYELSTLRSAVQAALAP